MLVAGAVLSLALPAAVRRPLIRLGRGSLTAYAVHIPFCYGALGTPLRHATTMGEATAALVPLVALSWGSVYAWDALEARARRRRLAPA